MGSPSGVPVPCISSRSTSAGMARADASAARSAACWLGPLGAVRLLLRPSWLTAAPTSSASAARLRNGPSYRRSTTAPTASART
eukprot:362107-Chlamydomonas_euryale.AAC.8